MSSQKVGSIKVPPFNRKTYNMWKVKMILFMKATNPGYAQMLADGPSEIVPMKVVTVDGIDKEVPKPLKEYSDDEKEEHALDTSLQLIIMDSMDDEMSHQVINCKTAKQMWDSIEKIMEGTPEVQENRLDILTSQYEAFKSLPGENITQVYERYNRLLNELRIHGKEYPLRESNRRFMLTLPHHIEHKASSIRERADFTTMKLEELYGK